ncbi:hypothetical protein DPMN_114307 [Dreissena polymorpha]|uniref:Uncharacterized protein n=1 Tax=Dreissena polymorpha TaxID=45954 RepID=A0A9D4KJR9_DREPO|nr:hypothetical protein DPMN_114307 [Dreissena polymorpha]
MLTRYHRLIFETHKEELTFASRTWVLQESEFQTIVYETVHGICGKCMVVDSGNGQSQEELSSSQRTFFIHESDHQVKQALLICPV